MSFMGLLCTLEVLLVCVSRLNPPEEELFGFCVLHWAVWLTRWTRLMGSVVCGMGLFTVQVVTFHWRLLLS